MVKRKIRLVWIAVAVTLAIILVIGGKKAGWWGDANAVKVALEEVDYQRIIELVSASGKIQPETQVKITPDVPGEIIELPVKEGDLVSKGQLLCKIRQDVYMSMRDRALAGLNTSRANVANAEARLIQAEAQLKNNEAIFKRQQSLFGKQAISQAEFDNAQAAFEGSKAEVEAARQSLNAAKFNVNNAEASLKESSDNLARTIILAPVSGRIARLNVELGERVVGTSQMAGTEIMTIADLREMEVKVDVNENDIVRLKLNDTADVEVEAYTGRKFKGIVTEIANSSNVVGELVTDQVTNFPVKIRILASSYDDLIPAGATDYSPFRPGMSATVDIRTRRVERALAVPVQSVTIREDTTSYGAGNKKKTTDNTSEQKGASDDNKDNREEPLQYVFIERDGKAILREVKPGVQDNYHIEILSGVKQGEKVISAPYKAISKTLKNNHPVKVVDKDELFSAEQREE